MKLEHRVSRRRSHCNGQSSTLFKGPDTGGLTVELGGKHVVIMYHSWFTTENGFSFSVGSELEAFQAAYLYRNMRTEIEFGQSVWRVVVRREVVRAVVDVLL